MANRIREFRTARGWSQAELADRVGKHWQTIQRLESGKVQLRDDMRDQLAHVFDIDPIELLIAATNVRTVEVLGHVQAGHWAEAWELPESDRFAIPIRDETDWKALELFAVETRGPSMDRIYPEGTVVVFASYHDTREPLMPGKRYIVERERADGLREATVKTLWRDDTGRLWLIPESTDPRFQEPIAIDGDDGDTIRIVGRVIYSVRRE